MNFLKYIKKDTFNDIKSIVTELDRLNKNDELLQSSVKFLMIKTEEFKSNWKLEDYEIDYINKQIIFHKKLAIIKTKYEQTKLKLSIKSRERIDELYENTEWTTIWKNEINYLKWKIKTETLKITDTKISNNTYRDFIETNINIKWKSETIYETWEIKLFYDLFTKYYLDLLEVSFSEKELQDMHEINKEKWLIISDDHIKNILYQIFNNFSEQLINFNNDLIILTWWNNIEIKISSIKRKVSQDRIKEEQKVKKESEKKFKITKIDKIIADWDIYKKTKKIFILEALKEKIITKDYLLLTSEKIPWFNYIDFMNNYWLFRNNK